MKISRHVSPAEQIRNSFTAEADLLEKFLQTATADSSKLDFVYRTGMSVAQLGSVIDVRSPQVPRALSLAAEAITGNFRLHRGAAASRPSGSTAKKLSTKR